MRSNICLARSEEDPCKAAKEAALACAYDALPVTEVSLALLWCLFFFVWFFFLCVQFSHFPLPPPQAVSVAHSVLRRCIDGGWLSMVGCLIQALHVPVVSVEDLCDFYKSPQVSYLRVLARGQAV